MISEPELAGEESPGRPAAPSIPAPRPGAGPAGPVSDAPDGSETLIGEGLPTVAPGRRPWLWALGGAVAASAVWTGGLYGYDMTGPDLHGYRVSRNLCLDAELSALSTGLGRKTEEQAGGDEKASLARAVCSVTLMPDGPRDPEKDTAPTPFAVVQVGYTLHKRTDPAAEFDETVTDLAPDAYGRPSAERLSGLGDRAYLVEMPSGDMIRLRVLDGRAVLTLDVTTATGYALDPVTGEQEETAPVDPGELRPELIDDMRELMAALKT
ncbi:MULTISPECIES: hypothetical protein [unclassified Streptomyces]|uniref:hypothetical protein n=1 Tax=unclassified Streptomyces TaxID=2593676 RepID=UPI00381C44FA